MKSVNQDILKSISFHTRADMELLFGASNLALFNKLSKAVEEKEFASDAQVMNILSGMLKTVSKYMLDELDNFFGNIVMQLSFFTYSLDRGETGEIHELLENLEEDNEIIMLSYLVKAYINTTLIHKPKNFDSKKVYSSTNSMLTFVAGADSGDLKTKDTIIEFLKNPVETKQRYCNLLRNFYEKLYKTFESEINFYMEKARQKYYIYFKKDPLGFFKNYLNMEPEKSVKKLDIHVSYLHQVSMLVLQGYQPGKPIWIGFGGNNDMNIIHNRAVRQENVQKFFKLLSDKTRLNILCLIKERPWFNQEVSDKLGIAPSTINHHFAALLESNIVIMEREDHRMYYSLNKDRLKELLNLASEFLIE